MHRVTRIPVVVINPMLTCKLCNGYLIDATTIVECLHSFCRSCILSYLKLHTTCPICDTLLHKTRPHYAIRPDRALQAMVYKLIPNLFEKEMSCRREFFKGMISKTHGFDSHC
ncbi:polycomb group RING finger protein 4 [Clonorchis sinensis]|uniref:Polycomb group RING finger protein 4 n=1 Tax=Clonorchis sinensis TaxID=79923 RepID=G7YWZ9_CLOSI|nr:polycomb group RING finger protein 4 [Clonorchis sinensis]